MYRQWLTVKLNKVDELVIKTLKDEGKALSLQEITDKTGQPSKKVFKSLKKLFENELIDTKGRQYALLDKKPDVSKDDEAELPEE